MSTFKCKGVTHLCIRQTYLRNMIKLREEGEDIVIYIIIIKISEHRTNSFYSGVNKNSVMLSAVHL